MKLSDLSEVSELDDRLQQIMREREKLVETREIEIRICGLTGYSETLDGKENAARAVLTAFDAYLEWLATDIKVRLQELGVTP